MRILLAFFTVLLASCGSLDWNKSDTEALCKANPAQCQAPTPVEEPLVFSGYVQRAFTITVNGVEFADAEDLYTRFIDELLLTDEANKARFEDAIIEVEGEYRVDAFGSGSRVFLASQTGDGHAYEATTGRDAKFRLEIKEDVSEEIFKARVVNRIGLKILKDGTEQHYCYLLHGYRDNVVIDKESKPIIFDEFSTQLTTYDCEKSTRNTLQVPSPKVDKEAEDKELPLDYSHYSPATKVFTSVYFVALLFVFNLKS